AARVDRFSLITQLEVQSRRPTPAAGATRRDDFVRIDPFADVLEQGFVASVQTQIAVAMVDDDEQAETTQPVRENDPSVGYSADFASRRRCDHEPVAVMFAFVAGAERRRDAAVHRPDQSTAQTLKWFRSG